MNDNKKITSVFSIARQPTIGKLSKCKHCNEMVAVGILASLRVELWHADLDLTGHLDVRMISKTEGEKNRTIKSYI